MYTPEELKAAVLLWTGWGSTMMPCRKDALVEERFGAELAVELIGAVKHLEGDFYLSDAWKTAADLSEMGKLATNEFKQKHPELPEEIAKAFAWCYTFDYK